MDYGKSLKIALAMKDIKRQDLAATLGVVPQQVSNWVTSGSISSANLKRVCAALDMKFSEFVKLGEESEA